MSGGGKVWLKDQENIYRHAKGLGIIDVPHPWGDDRKQGTEDDLTKSQWGNFTDRLNAAKEKATADGTQAFALGSNEEQKRRSSDWYRTPEGAAYAASIGKPVGFGINAAFPVEGSGGGSSVGSSVGSGSPTNPSTGIGPYPLDNMYFPQLTHAYEAPQAQDWSQFMPSGSPFSGMGGLLYQPGTQEYMEQFPMPDNLLNYQPPQINRQPVQYMNSLLGPMEVIMPEEESKSTTTTPPDPDQTDGRPGYAADGSNMPTFTDTVKSLFDLDDFDKWADKIGDMNAPGSAGQPPGLGIGSHPDRPD
jgi:hypothetical protein